MDNQKSKYRRALDDWMNEQGLNFKDNGDICGTVLSFVQFLEYREQIREQMLGKAIEGEEKEQGK